MLKKKEQHELLLHSENDEIEKLKSEKEILKKKYSDLEIKYENLKKYNSEVETQLSAVMNSTSWKFAFPVRLIKNTYVFLTRYLLNIKTYQKAFLILKNQGFSGLLDSAKFVFSLKKGNVTPHDWFLRSLPSAAMLVDFSLRKWPLNAPKFSVIISVYNTKHEWLKEALDSVLSQVYSNWELVLVDDFSSDKEIVKILNEYVAKDSRIKIIRNEKNLGISKSSNIAANAATGDYLIFMDHDDYLEPHALYRFADTAFLEGSEIIYSDEVITRQNINEIEHVVLRPAFSYDYYISHPYFVHLIGIKKKTFNEINGFDESLKVSHDYDLVLRAIEKAKKISHIPDVLYRWRTHEASLGHDKAVDVTKSSINALKKHTKRLGFNAEVKSGKSFNFYDVDFGLSKNKKIAIIIPTKNGAGILKKCIDSLERTVPESLADIYVINHDSTEAESLRYFEDLETKHTVLKYSGRFNFSKLINFGAKNVKGKYSHYLVLNNDIEALEAGWLEHMLSICSRDDVGIVGSFLLYPNYDVQHAGVLIGIFGVAEHAHKFNQYYAGENVALGYNGSFYSNRDYSAVTAACLLIRSDVYNEIEGFDEKLEVGFGDTDLCLRVVKAGYKVVMDSHAVLIHHESYTRGKSVGKDPHPIDTKIFMQRYSDILKNGDPFYSPQFYINSPRFTLNLGYKVPKQIRPRTVKVKLPKAV